MRIPYLLSINGTPYRLKEKPGYGHGGMSFEPVQDSSGEQAGNEASIYLPRISGAQLIMEGHSLKVLQDTLSLGSLTCILKIREGAAITTFTLAATSCTTKEVEEKDGIVTLDFSGGTSSGT